jgi:anti-anti-sigma regulatory factor
MNMPAAKLTVLVGERFACVRISGRANFTSSVDFKTVLTGLQRKGYNYIVIELSDCALMDSTFLGVLAGFGLNTLSPNENCAASVIELRNANERLTDLLENLGVLHLFKTKHGALSTPGGVETSAPSPCSPSREELTRASLEAHQTLMSISPENVERFKDVTNFLAEDLQKLRSRDSTDGNARSSE